MSNQLKLNFRVNVIQNYGQTLGYINSSKDVYTYMITEGYHKADREILLGVYLDAKNGIISIETHSIGTIDTSSVYPREIIKSALLNNASSIILVHNHPSGDPEPSDVDNDMTRAALKACELMGMRFLDHIILGNNRYYSYEEQHKLSVSNLK
jgi:DNA repair protein RadC